MGAVYDGDFWDFFSGKAPVKALSVGTVLTIAAAGSEGSPDAVITNEKTLEKNGAGADCLRPRFSVLNPALTQSLPPYQTACGITDIMRDASSRTSAESSPPPPGRPPCSVKASENLCRREITAARNTAKSTTATIN